MLYEMLITIVWPKRFVQRQVISNGLLDKELKLFSSTTFWHKEHLNFGSDICPVCTFTIWMQKVMLPREMSIVSDQACRVHKKVN